MVTEEHLRQLEESHLRHEVRSSPESMRALLAEDFVEFGSSGRVFDREAVIASATSERAFQWRLDEFAVRSLAPGVALTTYRLSAWSESEGQARVTLRSSVWVHRSGRWVLAFHQGTLAPKYTGNLVAIADELKAAQDLCDQIEPLTARLNGFDNAAAYEVARLIHDARVREGASPVGRKIGFSNRGIWREYGVCESIWAFVYDTTVVHLSGSRGTCRLGRFAEPRIEPEIVLHFRSTPPATDDPVELLACIDWIAHGIEIVQSHFPGWKFRAADTIADSALHGTLLVGEPQNVERLGPDLATRLEQFTVSLSCDGRVRDTGRGSNVLGSPLKAAAHLIAVLAKQPHAKALQGGELVTTGTLTGAFPIRAGETWSTVIDGIVLPGISIALDA
jgi:2-oxo-3-hexenedioate decarboxylase